MINQQSKASIFKLLYSAVILGVHTVMFYYVLFFKYNKILEAPLDSGGYLMVVLYAVILFVMFQIMGALKVGHNKKSNIILSHIIGIAFTDVLSYLQLSLVHRAFLPVYFIGIMFIAQIVVTIIWTMVVFKLDSKYIPVKKLILVYGDKSAEQIIYKMLEREDRYRICESVRYTGSSILTDDNFDYVKERIKNYESVIIYCLESSVRNDLLKFCFDNNIEVYLPPRISDIIIRGATEIEQFDSPLVVCRNCSLTAMQLWLKRAFDIVISLTGIVVSSPILLIIAAAIKLYDGGPVIFKQKRVTIDEKVFDIYKFRSMVVDAEKNDMVIPATDDDPRITPVGRIIRKVRFDELPQLFNILKGDMSVVGPRPERVEHHKAYTEQIPEFHFRTKVKAGLTGYAQVMGKYNTSPYDKLLLDLEYIQQFSFFLDFRIILLTVKVLFMKESTEGFKDNRINEENDNEKSD